VRTMHITSSDNVTTVDLSESLISLW